MKVARGLVVGKFCPLHAGHRLLLDTAQAQSKRLFVISYMKPENPLCLRAARDAWLAALYPRAVRLVVDDGTLAPLCAARGIDARSVPTDDAPEAEHREFCGWLCREVLRTSVNAVFTSEDYGDGFANALAVQFGHPVRHISVDRSRAAVPISGTRLREDAHLRAAFLPDIVRISLVRRVAVLGGESSGKTTLAAALAAQLGTAWVPEYGRELWEQRGGVLSFDDMLAIGREQVRREDKAAVDANEWLVCDTTPLTTAFYSEQMFGRVDPALAALAQRSYEVTLVCLPDIAFVQDGTRQDESFRQRGHEWYMATLIRLGITHRLVGGPPEARMTAALNALQSDW